MADPLTGLNRVNIETELQIAGTAVTATAAQLNALATGTQAADIADIVITYTTGDPSITPNGAVTVADGATPTVAELLELAEELIANQNAIIDALQAYGIVASS